MDKQRGTMFAIAAVAPRLAVRPASEVPRTLAPHTDLLTTLAVLVIGLVLVVAAIRSVWKQ